MLEYGINFNTKDGAAKAQKELEALHKRWQKIFDDAPLTVKFSKIDFDKLVRSGSMNKIAKDAQSIGEQIRKMRAEFRGLTVDEARAGAGSNIIERYRKLKAEAGIYAGTLDQAVKAQDRLAAESDKATGAIRRQNREFKKQSEVLTQLKSYAMNFLSVYAGIRMIKNLATITGEFEMQKTSIQAILQDAEKGAAIFERIKKLAVTSPFQFKDLISYTKQLSAFSVPYKDLYDTTKMLADLSAGLGVSMERLILAYGQVRSAAVLRGQELRQFTEAGIPIVEELRQKLSEANGELVTTGEVFDYISARKVPFEMVRDIIVEMTSEGGKFYKMQEVQAETLKGKIANLTDAFQIMLANIGEKDGGLMKGAVDATRALIENYEAVGRIIGKLAATYGVLKVATVISTFATMGDVVAIKALT
ncbi:MAG: tape measure protein, partial [Acutalibacteraceae bacterium]